MTVSQQSEARFGPWVALAVFAAIWIAIDALVEVSCRFVLLQFQIDGVRQRVAVEALSGVVLNWTMFAACVLVLHLRGQTLRDIGWRRPATRRSWILAIVVAALMAGSALASFGKTAQLLTDWSFYRISLGLVLGGSAGICLEMIFRGFVMTQARDAGLPVILQITLSAVLFALALNRMAWSGFPGHPEFWAVVGTTASSTVLGIAFAIIYVIGNRSLSPAIAAHAAIDMIVEPGMILMAAVAGSTAG
jgi:membrane protease YdiL (CAAX protease family)